MDSEMGYTLIACVILGALVGGIGAWIGMPFVVSATLSFLAGTFWAEKLGVALKTQMEG